MPVAALLLDTLLPYVLSLAIGDLATGQYESISNLIWVAASIGILGVIANLIGFQSLIIHESAVAQSLRDSTLKSLLSKDSEFFANQKIGGLTGKFIDFVNAHVAIQDLTIIQTLRFILSFGIGLTLIFINSSILGFIIIALLAILMVQVRFSLKLRRPLRQARKEMIAEINGAVADTITNNQAVKTFANEKYEESTIGKLGQKYKTIYRKDFRWMSIEGSGRLFLSAATQLVSVIVLAYLLQNNLVSVGIAVFTIAYLQRVASQLFSLGDMINGFDKVLLQAAPMTEILMENVNIKDAKRAKPLVVNKGAISIDNAVYKYSDSSEIAINNMTLRVKGGEKIGLVGRSGAGKTTLTKVLLRNDDLTSGSITIDGQNITKITQNSLRKNIAYVPQEPLLFHRTLKENIAYGRLEATDDEILDAAKKAHALEFIEKLPQGIDTIVGERGIKLSGGQRQRIAIARAILKDAPILVLDEATSALDSESEALIQSALATLMKGRTSIVIAHRLSTIAKLDRIIVLDKGQIVEEGKHAELLQRGGIYAKLWSRQSGGFIEE